MTRLGLRSSQTSDQKKMIHEWADGSDPDPEGRQGVDRGRREEVGHCLCIVDSPNSNGIVSTDSCPLLHCQNNITRL
jgi:hypothetical protein